MKKIGKISISYLALVAVIAFNFLAIHHHHHEMAVPIIVELLGSNGDDADSDASNTCHHPRIFAQNNNLTLLGICNER